MFDSIGGLCGVNICGTHLQMMRLKRSIMDPWLATFHINGSVMRHLCLQSGIFRSKHVQNISPGYSSECIMLANFASLSDLLSIQVTLSYISFLNITKCMTVFRNYQSRFFYPISRTKLRQDSIKMDNNLFWSNKRNFLYFIHNL